MDCRDQQAGQITPTWSVATKRKGRPWAAFHKHN